MFGRHNPRLRLALVGGVLVSAALAGVALALPIPSSGTSQIGMQNVGENQASLYNGTPFMDLPGASRDVVVGHGGLLVNARFTAESQCTSAGSSSCYVRILARQGATVLQLNPIDNLASFDGDEAGASNDGIESHAIERSRRLSDPGVWTIVVQRAVSVNGTSFILDDWHLAVETSA